MSLTRGTKKLVDFGADFKEIHGAMPSNGVLLPRNLQLVKILKITDKL